MAKSKMSVLKRQRELRKREKAAQKRERKEQRESGTGSQVATRDDLAGYGMAEDEEDEKQSGDGGESG